MTCEEVRGELSAFLDRELAPPLRRDVEQHLRACADCRSASSALEAVAGAVREATAVPDEVLPTDAVLAGLARMRREQAGAAHWVVVREVLVGALGVGGLLGAGLTLHPVGGVLRLLTLLCRPLVRGVIAEASAWAPPPLLGGALAGLAVFLILNILFALGGRRP